MSPIAGDTASLKKTENSILDWSKDGSRFEVGKGFPVPDCGPGRHYSIRNLQAISTHT